MDVREEEEEEQSRRPQEILLRPHGRYSIRRPGQERDKENDAWGDGGGDCESCVGNKGSKGSLNPRERCALYIGSPYLTILEDRGHGGSCVGGRC